MAGFTGDDLIEEALRYAGGEQSTADDVLSARYSMYLLMEEWAARWGQTFRVGRAFIDALPATPGFTLEAADVDEVIDVVVAAKPGPVEADEIYVPIANRLSASEYAKITNKLIDGQPSSFYLERGDPGPTLFCYPTGALRSATVWFHHKPAPFDHDRNKIDMPRRWFRALTLATALQVCAKRPWPGDPAMMNAQQARINQLEGWATQAFAEARPSDRERTPYRVRI